MPYRDEHASAIKALAYREDPITDSRGKVLNLPGLSEKYKQNEDYLKYLIRSRRNSAAEYLARRVEKNPDYDLGGLEWLLPYTDRTYTENDVFPIDVGLRAGLQTPSDRKDPVSPGEIESVLVSEDESISASHKI